MLSHGIGLVPMAVPITPSPEYAGFVGGLLLIGLVGIIGSAISRRQQWDDKVRLVLWIIVVGAILAQFPIIQALGSVFQQLLTVLADAAQLPESVGPNAAFGLTAVAAILLIIRFYKRPSPGRFLWMVIALVPLFGTDAVISLSNRFSEDIGINVFNGLNTVFSGFRGLRV